MTTIALNTNLSRNARRAIARYGTENCLQALYLHEVRGEGGYTVGLLMGYTTNQADAAINAGRELLAPAKGNDLFHAIKAWKGPQPLGLRAAQ